ncbi:unnamed protein product [Paramecium pentaurelia]|uniref:Uncharacterized protein n=1 Tax=Paramecium pentaurelia TaxID=43138 RepID=A0A8S1XAE9_9CILI|nr:unnamed protein product [Paramecium pentaurelia]
MSQILAPVVEQTTIPDGFILEQNSKTLMVTINRPNQANSFTLGMYLQLIEILKKAAEDDTVDIVLVKGNGKMFSSGNDMKNFSLFTLSTEEQRIQFATELVELIRELNNSILHFPKTLIACCHNGVFGFLFPMLALFDQVFVTEDCYFVAPMIQLGQGHEMFSSYTFPRLFGHSKSYSLMVNGERLLAKDAIECGFAQKMFKTKDEMYNHAQKICQSIEQMDRNSVMNGKLLMREALMSELSKAGERELKVNFKIWSQENLLDNVMKHMMRMRSRL